MTAFDFVSISLIITTTFSLVSGGRGDRFVIPSHSSNPCRVRPEDRDAVQYLKESVMYIFDIEIYNKTLDPLRTDVSSTYKPWKYYRTNSGHGKTLLTLSFNYDVLSMNILTIGVEKIHLKLVDFPEGCFANLTAEDRVNVLRDKVFDNFKRKRSTGKSPNQELGVDEIEEQPFTVYVCTEVVIEKEDFAEFGFRCCERDSEDNMVCSEKEDNLWISVLYVCIALVKLILFMFCPMLLPASMYTASYVASEYVVKQTKELKMTIYVSESETTSIRYKHRLTIDEISDWRRFRESIDNLPRDEICDIKVPELRIKVKGKRILSAHEPPTGLLTTVYDNLVRCKIRGLDPFKECCNSSVYASLEPFIKHKCTWENVVLIVMKVFMLLLVPLPFYIRAFVYFYFEINELTSRRDFVDNLGLDQKFNPFRMTIIQYLTPTHPLFIATYSCYFLSGIVISFSSDWVRDKLKSIARSACHDMNNVSRTSVLQVVIGLLLWPFKKLGVLALFTCPIVSILTAPLWGFIFILYCVPTVYLAYRLVYHTRKKMNTNNSLFEANFPLGKAKKKVHKVKRKLKTIDKGVHMERQAYPDDEHHSPCIAGYGRIYACRKLLIQLLVSVFCLFILFSAVFLFVESAGVIVEFLAFTMMGIIVNAGSTLRYVSMALLVIVYMHNCYNNVYENYLTFNYHIMDEIMDRVEDLKKIASLPSSMQENAAFQVKCVEAVDEIPTSLNLEKKDPQWKIGHLLLFFDSFDTPRIPLNLFKKLCEVRVHGAPGPVYINLLKATAKFSIIVVFLFFVMIVVMAFGSANQMSSTNQTLATLAGGFVPMLLKNVLSTKGPKLNLKTLSFKGQIDEIVAEYKQNWPIYDLVVEQYDPIAEAAAEKEKEKEKEDEKNKECDKDKGDEKNKNMDEKTNVVKENGGDLNKDKEEKDKINITVGNLSRTTSTLDIPQPFNDSTEDLRPTGIVRGPQWFRRLSINPMEDNYADLFVDLSEAEEQAPWEWAFGSTDSLGQTSVMLNEVNTANTQPSDPRMPYAPPNLPYTVNNGKNLYNV